MKTPAELSDLHLIEATRELVREERRITAQVIAHLEEIERRRLHLERGYSSMFAFCTEALGYSGDQAMRRISAMRLTRELPELRAKIQDGTLALTNLSKVQQFLNAEKCAGKKYSVEQKRELVLQMENVSTRECERKLATIAPEHTRRETVRAVSEEGTRISFVADAQFMADLERIQALLSHQLRSEEKFTELFKKMSAIVLKKIDPVQKHERRRKARAAGSTPSISSSGLGTATPTSAETKTETGTACVANIVMSAAKDAAVNAATDMAAATAPTLGAPQVQDAKPRRRQYPVAVVNALWRQAQSRCTYIDSQTGRRCEATHRLQIDHAFVPFGKGGGNDTANLTLLCQAHNLHRAIEVYGEALMSRFLRA